MGGGRKRSGSRGKRGGSLGRNQPPTQHQLHVQSVLEQQPAVADAQLERSAPASRGRRHTAAPPPPLPPSPDLLPIAFADGKVTVGDGLVLLDRISPLARQPHREQDEAPGAAALAASDMVVLSFAAGKGPTCMEDFALGAVSRAGRVCDLRLARGWLGGVCGHRRGLLQGCPRLPGPPPTRSAPVCA